MTGPTGVAEFDEMLAGFDRLLTDKDLQRQLLDAGLLVRIPRTEHDGHSLDLLTRGRPLTDAEIGCYLADHQTAIRHGTAYIGDEIAEQLRDRLAALDGPRHRQADELGHVTDGRLFHEALCTRCGLMLAYSVRDQVECVPLICTYRHPSWSTPCGQPPDGPLHSMARGYHYTGRMRHDFDGEPPA